MPLLGQCISLPAEGLIQTTSAREPAADSINRNNLDRLYWHPNRAHVNAPSILNIADGLSSRYILGRAKQQPHLMDKILRLESEPG